MLGRVIRKLVLAISVLAALTLTLLLFRTRHTDLLISAAKANEYHELRLGDGQVAFTLIDMWPEDEHVSWGRPPDPWKPEALRWRMPGMTGGRLIHMLDGAVIYLEPGTESQWSPIKRTDGRAHVIILTTKHADRPTSVPSGSSTQPYTKTVPSILPPDLSKISVTVPTPSPFSRPTEPTKASGDDLLATLNETGSIKLRVAPKAPPPPKNPGLGFVISPMPLRRIYRYERRALPAWAVILILLLPIWWTILRAIVRWQKRRVRRRRGWCEQCGYDLRGNPHSAACPECGAARPSPARVSTAELAHALESMR
jgi:hypothetical protein